MIYLANGEHIMQKCCAYVMIVAMLLLLISGCGLGDLEVYGRACRCAENRRMNGCLHLVRTKKCHPERPEGESKDPFPF